MEMMTLFLVVLGFGWLFHEAFSPSKPAQPPPPNQFHQAPQAPPNPERLDRARAIFQGIHNRQPDPMNPLDVATMTGISATLPNPPQESGPVILDKGAVVRVRPFFTAIHGREPSTRADWAVMARLIDALPPPPQPPPAYIPAPPYGQEVRQPINGNSAYHRPIPGAGVQYQG